jgi:hypothetical protein
MCSTCNHNNYEKIAVEIGGKTVERLETSLGYGSLVIRCDVHGKNRVLAVKNEPKSEFRMYRCPTCGATFLD